MVRRKLVAPTQPIWEPLGFEGAPRSTSPQRPKERASVGRAIARGAGWGVLGLLFGMLLALAGAIVIYAYYAVQLPSPQELRQRAASSFKSTKIYDRNGHLLFEVFDPLGGRRTLVRRGEMPEILVAAVISTEDATFYTNPGWNPFSIVRALYANLREGGVVQGGSTITQQLVKNLYLSQERTLARKIQEAILATEITRRYSKDEILELYLNEVYFGNLAYGIEAASETYFAKPVSQLTLAEAALLAGLIQSPALYDPYTAPEAARGRREVVLRLLRARGLITQAEFDQANQAPLGVVSRRIEMEAPHMVMFVRELLEREYGTEVLYKGGLRVYTTLDLEVQRLAEEIVRQKVGELAQYKASNASLVALDPATGEILAMVGSVDFWKEGYGQVNVALRPRQPGSTLKPFTYLAALERGWLPSTMVMDVSQTFSDGANPPYKPRNYDGKEYGPISVRTALACSRNIPAVATLHQIGLPTLLEMCHRLGISSLNRTDYGLSLTLGGGEVTLLELTAAYAALANGGYRVPPRAILAIEDQEGRTILPRSVPVLARAVDPRYAYLITHILADAEARKPAFGANNALELPFPSAAKTGTTDDFRDSWTIGYTPQLVLGVWVGNNDNSPMEGLSGARGAALIWHDVMIEVLKDAPHPDFARPDGVIEVEVCPISGQKRTDLCPPGHKDLFLAEHPPQECTLHREVIICRASGKLATEYCPPGEVERIRVEDYGPEWDAWAQARGIHTPPRETCDLHRAPVRVEIRLPERAVPGILPIWGRTEVADFAYYYVEYGSGKAPDSWHRITPEIAAPVFDGPLCTWDARDRKPGNYTVRLVVFDRRGQAYQATGVICLEAPATETPLPTFTPFPTATAVDTPSPTPSSTFAPIATATDIPSPTFTPTATEEPSPTFLATPTLTMPPTATEVPTPMPSATFTLTPSFAPTPTEVPTPPGPKEMPTPTPTQ